MLLLVCVRCLFVVLAYCFTVFLCWYSMYVCFCVVSFLLFYFVLMLCSMCVCVYFLLCCFVLMLLFDVCLVLFLTVLLCLNGLFPMIVWFPFLLFYFVLMLC